nr:MFS transporter [Actinomycetales bacterium]
VWSAVAVIAARAGAVPARFVRSAESEADAATPATPRSVARRRFPWKLFIPLALLAITGTLVEEVANNWVTLYLSRDLGAAIGLAGIGFATTLGAQFVGRLLGDPMTDRWGRDAVARSGGVMIAAGGLLVVLSPYVWLAMVGFAIAGFGTATLVPAAYAASDSLPGVPHGTGVAMLGWWMRLGFLFTSPVVGVIADAVELRFALLLLVAAGATATVIGHQLMRRE